MKKLFFLFLALVATTSLWAQRFQVGDLYYNITSGTTVEVTSGGYYDLTTATIPSTVTYNGTTYSVTSIGDWAFYFCSSLTSITIPNSVTSIGDYAFLDCSSLTSVTLNSNDIVSKKYTYEKGISDIFGSQVEEYILGNSVTSIGDWAFRYCSSLTSVTIPNSVTSIGGGAFAGCSGFTSITIPNSVTSIGNMAFSDCSSLTSITIPNSVTTVGGGMFYGCSKLKSVVLSNNITSLPSYNDFSDAYGFFENCSSLTSVTIPNSVTSIGDQAFYNCSSIDTVVWNAKNCADSPFGGIRSQIRSFTFGDSVEHIPANLCRDMKNLTSLIIPESVMSIGNEAFRNCSSLTSITIPNSVTSIGEWAFQNCSSLTSITIPNSVTSIGDYAFNSCSSLTSVTILNSVTSIGNGVFSNCSSLTSITIPNSVTSIGDHAFSGCSSLTSITIPNNVTNIGKAAFSSCDSLTSVVWNVKNCADFSSWNSEDYPFDNCDHITSFIFGDSVEHIPAHLCYEMENLTNLIIPNSVTSIGDEAFRYCSSIDTVVWNAKNCADFEWSSSPFHYSNDSITSFTFGDSVKHIPAYLCYDMTNLTSLIIPESVMSIGNESFYSCESLTSVTIPNSVTSIGSHAFCGCSSVTSLTLGNNLTTIGSSAFSNLGALTSVTQKAPSIEAYCQGQVSKLLYDSASLKYDAIRTIEINGEEVTDWVIPSSITKIEDYTFYNCPSITSVALPNTIISIGESAFENCTSITAITIPNKVTRIGACAFSKCPITDIIIPNNVTNIGDYAFSNCDKLSSLILGESVDSIGGGAFYGCRKLYDIYCYAPEPPYAIASGWNPSFENFNVNLYVPCDNLKAFQMDPVFGTFKYIHCIDSEDVPADGVIITPGFTDVTITWPTDDDADNYIIVIEKDGEVVCTLTFNADGQLLNIAFAPGRDGNHPVQYAEQAGKGFRFTVTGLEEGVDYTYDVIVKDANNKNINTHSGRFTTQSHTAVDNITTDNANIQKILRNGQLLIIRDGKTYNAIGQEM